MSNIINPEMHAPVKVLLVYPEYVVNFWSVKYALELTNSKAALPPLGLATVASMLPKEWEKKLVDLNIESLEDKHLQWADYVFIGAMDIQKNSAIEVINRCKKLGAKIVAGGPLFTEHYEDFENIDHLVLGEAETTLPLFLKDLENGKPKHLYLQGEFPSMEKSPPPMWDIVDMKKYFYMCMQFSRGCPFDCEFCQITRLFGRKMRSKSKEQIIEELDALYNLGWNRPIFFVDDNLIGDKHKLRNEILPAVLEWMEKRDYPFYFLTQASVNLADDEELMQLMVRAGFGSVFVGIENVDDDCLAETGKFHNRNRDLVANVKKMQRTGLDVWAGFIVGFDSDKESIFDRTIKFIQESGVTLVMMNVLRALKGTRLYERLEEENRIIGENTGDTMDFTTNIIPKMGRETLLKGHKKILRNIYSPEPYYLRLLTFLREYRPPKWGSRGNIASHYPTLEYPKSLIRTMVVLGIFEKGRFFYWKLFFWTLLNRPELLPYTMTLWTHGYDARKVFGI